MQIIRRQNLKQKEADASKLGFGQIFTDHMLIMECNDGIWGDERIVPYGPILLEPSSTVLHYAQELFEGLKAYRTDDDRILLFRAKDNFRRMNIGAQRLCLPELDVDKTYDAMIELLKIDKDWVPNGENTSLYIRPTIFGNDPKLGVNAASKVMFFIILSPSGPYYSTGLAPTKIYVEDHYVRSVEGGMGYTKTGGNYAASLKAGVDAYKKGYNQVLWLDGVERKYIEEVGAMNMFFLFNDELATPALHGSILDGITRRSVIELARDNGIKVVERKIAMEEVYERAMNGELLEAFGSGTAAVISPVGELGWREHHIVINNGKIGAVTKSLYDEITGIQTGKRQDKKGWVTEVK